MRTQFCAIRKVNRNVGIEYDIAHFYFCYVRNAISSPELQQLIDVIRDSDEDFGIENYMVIKYN
jgi:hypothetical protein